MKAKHALTFLVLAVATYVLSGCAAQQTRMLTHDVIRFRGDAQPKVTSSDILSGTLTNLSEGETLVAAVARDGSGALSQPTIATVNVVETIITNTNLDRDLALLDRDSALERCDPDSDGFLDIYCPELASMMSSGALGNEQYVLLQSWQVLSKDRHSDEDHWQDSATIDIAEEKIRNVPVHLKMLTVNRGNKIFTGDLLVHSRLPSQLTPGKIDEVSKVRDNTATKEFTGDLGSTISSAGGLGSMIPLYGLPLLLMSEMMDNYQVVQSNARFESEYTPDGNIKIVAEDITLGPGEGINVEYTANYEIED